MIILSLVILQDGRVEVTLRKMSHVENLEGGIKGSYTS